MKTIYFDVEIKRHGQIKNLEIEYGDFHSVAIINGYKYLHEEIQRKYPGWLITSIYLHKGF